MGVIPTFTTPASAVPNSPGMPLADAGALTLPYAQQAQAGKETAEAGMTFAQKYIGAKLEVDAADQTADLSKQLQQAEFESSKIPDRAQATAQYDARTQKIFDGYEQSGANPLVKAHVTARFRQLQTLGRAQTQSQSFALESQTQRGKLITQLDDYAKQATIATDPRYRDALIESGVAAIDGRVAGGWMNPEAGAKAKVDFESGIYRNIIDLEMAKNPRVGVAMYELYKGKLNAQDSHITGVQVEDKRVDLKAEEYVNKRLPVVGSYLDNNIGNIVKSEFQFKGGKTPIGGAFEGFESPEHGVAASYINIKAKADANGGSITFNDLIAGNAKVRGWAAADDGKTPLLKGNNPSAYAERLAKKLGMSANDNVPMGDDAKMAQLLREMNVTEKGRETVKPEMYERGVKYAKGDPSITPTAPSGDALANYRTEALKAEQELLADNSMDPRERQRALMILQQRSRTTEGLVLSQRKQITDQAETAALGLFNGTYVQGTFAKLAQSYRDTGDNSQAAVYDFLATNESALRDFASLPPSAQRTLGHVLPGTAGKIAQSILADSRTDRKEFREQAAQQHALFTKGLQEGLDPSALIANARDAVSYYAAAGDRIKAKEVMDAYQGAIDGWRAGGKPTAEAEAALRDLKELAESQNGLDTRTSSALQVLEKAIQKNRDTWKNDPIVAAERYTGKLDAYRPGMPPAELQLWANKRVEQAGTAQYMKDPSATVMVTPMFTQTEIDALKSHLTTGSVQDRQVELARLSTAIPAEQVPLVAQKIAGNDKLGDSWATAMAFYKRGQPGDRQIADSLIAGSNTWVEGGAEGREKVKLNPATFTEINNLLGTARAGMDGRDLDMQNNAVAARYISLLAGKDPGTSIDTTILGKAVADIIGTKMNYHGGQHILPTGVQPYQFEDGIANMTAADLPPLQPAGTTPITVERIKQSATYQSVGDGLYKVWMPDPKAGGTHEVVRSDTGRPWIVDIRPLLSRTQAGGERMQRNLDLMQSVQ